MGKYRVFKEIDVVSGRVVRDENNTFLKGRNGTMVFRYNDKQLSLYFLSKPNKTQLAEFKESGVELSLFVEGDREAVYHFLEEELDKVHKIIKLRTRGKNIEPSNKSTREILMKECGYNKGKKTKAKKKSKNKKKSQV